MSVEEKLTYRSTKIKLQESIILITKENERNYKRPE